jgi:hypothetical protein
LLAGSASHLGRKIARQIRRELPSSGPSNRRRRTGSL